MDATARASEALRLLLEQYRFDSVLDVGPGDGAHARKFRAAGKRVGVVDLAPPNWPDAGDFETFVGDFCRVPIRGRWDCIWASHVLEHSAEPQRFLARIHDVISPGGVVAVTVPPRKDEVVPAHLTLWTGGLLLYHLILARFDCREARVRCYDYNVSVITPYRPLVAAPKHWEEQRTFFPPGAVRGDGRVEGAIERLNWP